MAKIVLSRHASERMFLRGISKSLVHNTVKNYDFIKYEEDGDICYIKKLKKNGAKKRQVYVVTKQLPHEGKDTWLVKTVWIRGEEDPGPVMKAIRMFLMRLWHRR